MIINNANIAKKKKANLLDKNIIKNILLSFLSGGLLGFIAQCIYLLFKNIIDNQISSTLTSGIIIIISFLLTCFGVFDNIARIAHSGVIIPISGFANSITSCALEGKSEGLIFGIGSKIFSLVGSVFTYGIVSCVVLGFIYYFIRMI